MLSGIIAALAAGLVWGLVFIAPLLLPEYPGAILSFGRYAAFGLIALIPAWFDRRRIASLKRADWIVAIKLSTVGNIFYYATLSTAIQLADAPLPTMLIGTLPVAIAIFSNWSPHHPSDSIAWKKLILPLVFIFVGLLLVNAVELHQLNGKRSVADYVKGGLLALLAVGAWTWYPIINGRYLKANQQIRSSTWATAQGLAVLPLALIGFALFGVANGLDLTATRYVFPLGAQPMKFVIGMVILGFSASWLGTLLWNHASQKLPTSLAGTLIVFETLAALLYTFILRGNMPSPQIILGVILLCLGVALSVRVFQPVAH
ncbi:MAG: DMT family transporter [Pseudomonadota bacterium]